MKRDMFLVIVVASVAIAAQPKSDLSDFNIIEIIQMYGYPVQIHEIVTEDGYLINIHRVPHGKKGKGNQANPNPVLLHHGLLCTADNWIWAGPNKSLAYVLADNGYDVWMMNDRGTMHSRKHVRMNPDTDKDYWQFTFHEIGVYDIPNTIDYILESTNKQKLHYVGHSQGVTTMLVMGSERPEYNEKVKVMIGLAPAATFKYMKHNFINRLMNYQRLLFDVIDILQVYEFPPPYLRPIIIRVILDACKTDYSSESLCKMALDFGGEEDMRLIDTSILPHVISTLLTGSSVKQFTHFAQIITSGKFKQFDWGWQENLQRYNSTIPPAYNFKNMIYPTGLFFSGNDAVVSEKDTAHLAKLLPNVIEFYKVPFENFNHLDFLWSKDIYPLVNKRVLHVMNKYIDK